MTGTVAKESGLIKVVAIQFTPAGKLYDFNAGTLDLKPGDRVVVETERGSALGMVVTAPVETAAEKITTTLSTVKRLLGPDDDRTIQHHTLREKEARDFCIRRIKERGLDMKLVRVEYLFDGSKAIFYFTADGRIDFRELVKDLAHTFHTRIEMRQIGVRDEAKMVGGLGICGRELCCSSFLRDFQPVSVKMAKEQNLALNPSKISGQCGRLLCCLDYEYETYCSLRKNFPKSGKYVRTAQVDGTVEKTNLLTGELLLRQKDGKQVSVHLNELVDENSPLPVAAPAGEELPLPSPRRERGPLFQKKQRSAALLPQFPAEPEAPAALTATAETKAGGQPLKPEEKSRRKKRNRRHGHHKNRDQKPDTPSQE